MIRLLRSRLCAILVALALARTALAERRGADERLGSGTLEPTYQPRPPPEKEVYTTDYLFAITRAVSESTLVPAAQVPLYYPDDSARHRLLADRS